MTNLPRHVWMLWSQGWDQAPALSRACVQTWRQRNPGWEIHALTASNLPDYLDLSAVTHAASSPHLTPAAVSDIVRIHLLSRHGGVWADSTVWCAKPLDDWLPACVEEGFFAFDRPGPDRMVASWFLASVPGNPIVDRWAGLVDDYWHWHASADTYFWFHYLFADGYQRWPQWRAAWDATPKLPADGPHRFIPYEVKLPLPLTDLDRRHLNGLHEPVYKLSRHVDEQLGLEGSLFRYVCDAAETGKEPLGNEE
jgi:hypothetical protein